MKTVNELYKSGWWIKVSPLARISPECWLCTIFKRTKVSWVTEECAEFSDPVEACEWANQYISDRLDDG